MNNTKKYIFVNSIEGGGGFDAFKAMAKSMAESMPSKEKIKSAMSEKFKKIAESGEKLKTMAKSLSSEALDKMAKTGEKMKTMAKSLSSEALDKLEKYKEKMKTMAKSLSSEALNKMEKMKTMAKSLSSEALDKMAKSKEKMQTMVKSLSSEALEKMNKILPSKKSSEQSESLEESLIQSEAPEVSAEAPVEASIQSDAYVEAPITVSRKVQKRAPKEVSEETFAEAFGEEIPEIAVDDITKTESNIDVMDPSQMPLYTIPVDTVLYHGTKNISQFNTTKIDLGNDSLVAFFSPNKAYASSYITECALFPKETGYIHVFKVIKPIDKIFILSSTDKNLEWTEEALKNKFCDNDEHGRLNGVGFFVNKDKVNKFSNSKSNSRNSELFNSEFALCDPSSYLVYTGTYSCVGTRNLSPLYKFTN